MTAPTPPPLPSEPAPAAAVPPVLPDTVPTANADPTAPAAAPRYTCSNCGAQLHYEPGTTSLKCSACGAEQAIAPDGRAIVEHSYDEWASLPAKPVATIAKQVLQCQNCGATTETDLLADRCQFCGGVLIALASPPGLVVPEVVVPFGIGQGAAKDAFTKWVRSRWFAPTELKKVGSTEAIKGTYVPHWTYDAHTDTDYVGQRGEHYWVTVTHTVSDGNGGTRQETSQEMRTRWWPASGNVTRDFDDVLVKGSHQLPDKRLDQAGPWDLTKGVAYRPEFLAGYSALRYDVDPDVGLQDARKQMERVVEDDCERDIGGDEQIVNNMDVRYSAVMFKLVLLPLWIATYLHAGKTFQVLVNANTGEVVGDRPISKLKVALAVAAVVIVIAAAIVIYLATKKSGG